MTRQDLDREIAAVVEAGNCTGCGMCTLLDRGLEMRLDDAGYARPARIASTGPEPAASAVDDFRAACPGRGVRAQRPSGATYHPTMGPIVEIFEAWAADPEQRHRGSSGGALTALSAWLIDIGEASTMIGAGADAAAPRRTVSVRIQSREEALASAGSRYAPVSNAAAADIGDGDGVFVGKPCEAAAVRALQERRHPDAPGPLLLAFFCAGTPSQQATETLVEQLGIATDEPLEDLWYRGRGWPGEFTAVPKSGPVASTSYDASWGDHLGKALQWRCKICPDGVGESADVVAADYWRTDDRGYPVFTDGEGISALLARTQRGADVIRRAIDAGVIIARPITADAVAAVQPLQRQRRRTLLGRLLGARSAGARVPRFSGFGLTRLAISHLRENIRTARGTRSRYRRQRASA